MPTFSTFSPSAMSSDLIEGAFVQREPLAERLVAIFEESALRETKHNVLLVGPRGIGKSHLVSLVYHRLSRKQGLSEKLCIAFLREDEWGINSFLDFLVRTLRAAFEEAGLETPGSLNDLSMLNEAQAEDHVWRCLKGLLGVKTLLVIVENLDAVFEKIGDSGQRKLRALMQTHPQWAILATTPALFSGISRQVSPFYGFFEVIHLQPLSFDGAVTLLQKLACLSGDKETEALLGTAIGRARIRAVQHIAGGNHRILVLFYGFLRESESQQFVEPLLKTIDALTPYYQSHMARLSPQQQKIVNFLCELGAPATVTAIAASCFTTHQTAAGQLKQLLGKRYVRVDRVGRQAFYELSEPLLRICVEVKTHRERPLRLLVDFIRYWFSREQLERKLSENRDTQPGKEYFLAALQQYDMQDAHIHLDPEIAPLCSALNKGTDSPDRLRAIADELAELSKIAEDWPHYSRAMAWLDKSAQAVPVLEKKLQEGKYGAQLLRALATAHAYGGSMERAHDLLDRAIALRPNDGVLLFEKGDFLARSGRDEEALNAYEQAVFFESGLAPLIALEKARVLNKMARFRAAREVLRPILAKGKTVRGVFLQYGIALASEGEFEKAVEYFGKAASAFENDSIAWGNKGRTLVRLGKFEDALPALDESLRLDSSNDQFQHYLGEALLATGRYSVAVEALRSEVLSHNILHWLLGIANTRPRQGKLQQDILKLWGADSSEAWQEAFVGGLTEFLNSASAEDSPEALEDIETWNAALRELFSKERRFSVLLKLFDVLTRVKVHNDTKALLELPLEQRLLLTNNGVN